MNDVCYHIVNGVLFACCGVDLVGTALLAQYEGAASGHEKCQCVPDEVSGPKLLLC
jgi:hypothetical protein